MRRFFSLYRVELRRLLSAKTTWTTAVLCLFTLIPGYFMYPGSTSSNRYIAGPMTTASALGAILWAALTVIETDRLHRNGADILTDAIAPPAALCAARLSAILTGCVCTAVITAVVWMPYTASKMAYLFLADFYFLNVFILVLPTWWISVLLADAFYQITRRTDLSVMLYALLAAFGIYGISQGDYYISWLLPYIITYSDGFVSLWPLRINLYARIIWLCIASGGWLFSLLCIRRYQRGLVFSFIKAQKKARILFPAVFAAFCGGILWHFQPFIDHGPDEYIPRDVYAFTAERGILSARFTIKACPVSGSIRARAEYKLESPCEGENLLTLNPGYRISRMTYDGQDVPFRTVDEDINGERPTYFTLPDTYGKILVIEYGGMPTVSKYQAKYRVEGTIDHNYITLSGVEIFPILHNYALWGNAVADITIPDNLTPFFDFKQMTEFTDNGDGTRTWRSRCGAYVRDFTAGHYAVETIPIEYTTLDFAYGTAYQKVVEESRVKAAVQKVFSYCSDHYGNLSWSENSHLLLQQRSAMFMGGFAQRGVSQWFETVLSPDTLNDPNKGSSATEVFIHEMVHQWWGGLGLNCAEEELWTSEGVTVYSTYRIVKELYGDAYAQQYYADAWKKAVDQQNRSFYNRHPEYLELLPESYRAFVNSSNSSINWYSRMPLMILKAELLVGGEEKMDEILKKMYADRNLEKFSDYSGETPGFGYQDFLEYCGLDEEDLILEQDFYE